MVDITKDIEKLIQLTDLFLLDIKHIDNDKCKLLTGCSNEKELDFAKYLSECNKKMWIRQVIIPGVTDKIEDLVKLKDFISTLKTVENIEFLPYHSLGKYKWEELGHAYELEDIKSATEEDIKKAKEIFNI